MKIKVTTPNRMIVVRGVLVRTPVEIEINSKREYKFFETYLKGQCAEFEIIDDKVKKIAPKVIQKVKPLKTIELEEPKIEESINTITADDDYDDNDIEETDNTEDISPQLDENLNNIDEETNDEEVIEPVIEEMGSGKILDKILTD